MLCVDNETRLIKLVKIAAKKKKKKISFTNLRSFSIKEANKLELKVGEGEFLENDEKYTLSTMDFKAKVLRKTTVRINQNGASELWGTYGGGGGGVGVEESGEMDLGQG